MNVFKDDRHAELQWRSSYFNKEVKNIEKQITKRRRDMYRYISCAVLVIILFLIGCTGSSESRVTEGRYTTAVGTATFSGLRNNFEKIVLDRYHYEYEIQRETTTSLYYETRWKERAPFDDELQRGIEAVRMRIIVEGRPRTRRGDEGGELYAVRFTGEILVNYIASDQWISSPMSREARNYFRAITRDLDVELRTGFRGI